MSGPGPGGARAGTIHLVRHAHAFPRRAWEGEDRDRPLSQLGAAQSELLGARLAARPVTALLASPALRCRATLGPLADGLGLEIELAEALGEGHPGRPALEALLDRAVRGPGELVACTHGDVLQEVLSVLEAEGVTFDSPLAVPKAGSWELALEGPRVARAWLVPPPAVAG